MKKILFLSVFFLFSFFSCGFSNTNQDNAQAADDLPEEEFRSQVLITTPMGNMVVELFNETPLHRDNFIKLAESGFYDSTLFHRVIKDFMIQGGDPDSKNATPGVQLGMGGPDYNIPAEIVDGIYHQKGSLSAARQGDQVNPQKESSGSQFYIVQGKVFTPEEITMVEQRTGKTLNDQQRTIYTTVGGTPHLDGDYTVFGRVTEGLDVLDRIAEVLTDRANRPIDDVPMTMSVIKK